MDLKEARYVVRLAHKSVYTPADQATLLYKVRERVSPLNGQATNLRVSRIAMEFDLFCQPEIELHRFLNALEPVGRPLTYARLDLPIPTPAPEQVLSEARKLYNEERYWEAHEVLEGLWRITQGDEKRLLQGLILTAAALVHAQKNEPAIVKPMLEESLRRFDRQPATYYGLNIEEFVVQINRLIELPASHFPTI